MMAILDWGDILIEFHDLAIRFQGIRSEQ